MKTHTKILPSLAESVLNAPSFLSCTPVPLVFGTSGLRGLVKDITDLEAYINVKGAFRYLLSMGDVRSQSKIVLAGDLRPSTERIMRACAQALGDLSFRVEHAGRIPTPALAFYAIAKSRPSVMVTGSHIPFDRNGIKIYKSAGEILKEDETAISHEVNRVRSEEYGRTAATSAFNTNGMLKSSPELPAVERAAEEAYIHRYLQCFDRRGLTCVRVLVYQHSAVGRDILARILRELGAEVVTAGRSETFIPIDTENITAAQLDQLEAFAIDFEARGEPLQAIVSTDGDSDRPLMLAVRPAAEVTPGGRRVRFLPGDLLGLVAAEYLRADAAAVPISANDGVERRLREHNITLEKTKIGSPYVVAAIDALRSAGPHARVVGWEANGGFLTGSDMPLNGGRLEALPTRDATLPILASLFAATEQGIGLDTLWNRLPSRFGSAGLLDNFPVQASQAILAQLIPTGVVIDAEFGHKAVRDCHSTELRGASASKSWHHCVAALKRFFTPALGFDDLARINVLDGVRIYFRNGDIAHIRPSGNAPQLRIYANSDTQVRADQIVQLALREPDGILRQLQRALS